MTISNSKRVGDLISGRSRWRSISKKMGGSNKRERERETRKKIDQQMTLASCLASGDYYYRYEYCDAVGRGGGDSAPRSEPRLMRTYQTVRCVMKMNPDDWIWLDWANAAHPALIGKRKKTWLASLQIQTLDDRGAPVEVEMPLEEQQPNKKKLGKNGKKER